MSIKVLIACSGDKLRAAAEARQLYQGPQFRMRWAWAETLHDGVAGILSAKYGVVLPDQVIEYYDLKLTQLNKAARGQWADRVRDQIQATFPKGSHLIVLAGRAYVEGWMDSVRGRTIEWRRFRGIGYERQALTREMAKARAQVGGASK